MKKIISIIIIALLAISVLISPAIAAVTTNSASWDGGIDWLNSYTVKGWISLDSYTGSIPTVHIWGITNCGNEFSAQRSTLGTSYTNSATCDLQGSLPLLKGWDKWIYQ